jgi:hypothetical protein
MKLSVAPILALCLTFSSGASAQDVHVVRILNGFQCISLAKLWNGIGQQPPRVHVYGSPDPNAAPIGFAGETLIAPSPLKVEAGRIPIIWPNGRTVWVNQTDTARWHVASDPKATCTPALLSNGRYGHDSKG